MRSAALILLATLAACGPAAAAVDSAYVKAIADFNPTERLTASGFYMKDCGEPANGSVTCHACTTELIVSKEGEIDMYAHVDEIELDGIPAKPHVLRTVEGPHIAAHMSDGVMEAARGPASFKAYLTHQYENGNIWCSQQGGERHEIKNVIPDVANGNYVL